MRNDDYRLSRTEVRDDCGPNTENTSLRQLAALPEDRRSEEAFFTNNILAKQP